MTLLYYVHFVYVCSYKCYRSIKVENVVVNINEYNGRKPLHDREVAKEKENT